MSQAKPVLVNGPKDDIPSLPVALEKNGVDAEFYTPTTMGQWVKALSNRRVLVAFSLPEFMPEVLESCEGVKMIQRFGIGYDDVPIEIASKRGIFVCNVPEAMAESVAQHAWSLIFALASRVLEGYARIARGKWGDETLGMEIWGKTLGVVGLGDIGRRVTRIGNALNMRILAYDPYVSSTTAQLFAAEMVDLQTLLKNSDIVCMTVSLTKETAGMISEKELSLMKKTALLINVSRGRVIREKALVRTLETKMIGGAGLDVYEKEPLPEDSPLRQLKNVVLTPHISSHTLEAFTRTSEAVGENTAQLLRNERPRWIVNAEGLKKHGYLD